MPSTMKNTVIDAAGNVLTSRSKNAEESNAADRSLPINSARLAESRVFRK
jgi:hypothetical protein